MGEQGIKMDQEESTPLVHSKQHSKKKDSDVKKPESNPSATAEDLPAYNATQPQLSYPPPVGQATVLGYGTQELGVYPPAMYKLCSGPNGTVLIQQAPAPPPDSYIPLAILCFFLNLPFGMVAMCFALNSLDAAHRGDMQDARVSGLTARRIALIGISFSLAITIISFIYAASAARSPESESSVIFYSG